MRAPGISSIVLALVLLNAGCGAQPAPEFFASTRTEVVRDGRTYVVFQKNNRVEVIRLGYARRGEHQAIRAAMIDLVTEVTGCPPAPNSLQGDSGEMRATLQCPRKTG